MRLAEKERETLAALPRASVTADRLYPLVQDFVQLVRTRGGERLDCWISQGRAGPIRE